MDDRPIPPSRENGKPDVADDQDSSKLIHYAEWQVNVDITNMLMEFLITCSNLYSCSIAVFLKLHPFSTLQTEDKESEEDEFVDFDDDFNLRSRHSTQIRKMKFHSELFFSYYDLSVHSCRK